MAWDAQLDSSSPAVKRGTEDALFQPEEITLSFMFCKCLQLVLLTSSEELRMCGMEGRIWGEGLEKKREVVVPAPPPPTC